MTNNHVMCLNKPKSFILTLGRRIVLPSILQSVSRPPCIQIYCVGVYTVKPQRRRRVKVYKRPTMPSDRSMMFHNVVTEHCSHYYDIILKKTHI